MGCDYMRPFADELYADAHIASAFYAGRREGAINNGSYVFAHRTLKIRFTIMMDYVIASVCVFNSIEEVSQ